jgi:uncharacterized membrane protein YvlD (DUF360 family)
MIRLLVRAAIFIGSAAIGLLVADAVLDDMSVSWTSLVVVAAIFAAIQSVIAPFLVKVTARNMPALVGGVGLFSVLIALMVTSWISDGLQISGAGTWLLAGLIVWLVTMIATLLLPVILVKLGVEAARDRRSGG